MTMTQTETPKIRRQAVTFYIYEKNIGGKLEWRVMNGNKILARYSDHAEAHAHLDQIFKR